MAVGQKITGMKVKLFVKDTLTGKVLAGQQGASLSRSAESIDATSKDSEGYWNESLQGFKSWSIDCDGAFVTDDEAYAILETAYLNSENVEIYLEMPSGKKYEGAATITDNSLDFPYDDLVTYSLSFQGSGELKIVDAPAGAPAKPVSK